MRAGGADVDALYRAERSGVELYVMRHGATQQEAHDAVQIAFVRLIEHGDAVQQPAPWLRTVALNEFFSSSRRFRNRRRRAIETPVVPWRLRHPELVTSAADVSELTEEERQVVAAIATLPDKQQQVMAFHFDGFSNDQIAEVTGLKPAAVRQNLRRARNALKKQLAIGQEDIS